MNDWICICCAFALDLQFALSEFFCFWFSLFHMVNTICLLLFFSAVSSTYSRIRLLSQYLFIIFQYNVCSWIQSWWECKNQQATTTKWRTYETVTDSLGHVKQTENELHSTSGTDFRSHDSFRVYRFLSMVWSETRSFANITCDELIFWIWKLKETGPVRRKKNLL